MKTSLLLAASLILAGCSRQDQSNREVLAQLAAIRTELAVRGAAPVRWAFANKREIDSAVLKWSLSKMEDANKAEALSPDMEDKIRQYEALQTELMHKRMEAMRLRMPPRTLGAEAPAPDKDYEALAARVAEAKAPVAEIVDRRSRKSGEYREQFSADKLVAECAKGRFDLVVDSSDERFSRSAVLYRANADVLDITDSVIKYFKEKTKP
jgi:hypothetical protein